MPRRSAASPARPRSIWKYHWYHSGTGTRRGQGVGDVLNLVAVDRDKPDAALRPKRRADASRAAAPVITCEDRARNGKRIHQRHKIRADRSLLAGTRRGRREKACRTVAAQIGHDHAATPFSQHRRYIDVGVNVVGKTVHQQYDRAVRGSRLEIGDVEHAGLDMTERLKPLRRRCT